MLYIQTCINYINSPQMLDGKEWYDFHQESEESFAVRNNLNSLSGIVYRL